MKHHVIVSPLYSSQQHTMYQYSLHLQRPHRITMIITMHDVVIDKIVMEVVMSHVHFHYAGIAIASIL